MSMGPEKITGIAMSADVDVTDAAKRVPELGLGLHAEHGAIYQIESG
jgi:hypothetical protein